MAKLFTDADHAPSVSSFDVKSVYVCLILVLSLTYAASTVYDQQCLFSSHKSSFWVCVRFQHRSLFSLVATNLRPFLSRKDFSVRAINPVNT